MIDLDRRSDVQTWSIVLLKYGAVFSTFYYDKNNNEISKEQFIGDTIQFSSCGGVTVDYLIHGQKKKKFNDSLGD